MTRTFFLVAVLATPLGLFAQNRPAGTNPAPPQNGTVEVPATNIYVVGGGLYGGGVYVIPPVAAATGASESTVGISLAGRAGISLNTPVELGVQSTLAPTNPVPNYGYGYGSAPPGYAEPGTAVAESERVRDLGPAYFVESGTSASAAAGPSLAEIAAQYKTNRPQAIRTYTNADVEKLTNKVTIAGAAGTGTGTPPTAEPAITQPQAPARQPELAANANEPRVGPESTRAETTTTLLPATSSYLPLLGLLGLLSSGIGLWVRRFLK